jgi:hypothetical protein
MVRNGCRLKPSVSYESIRNNSTIINGEYVFGCGRKKEKELADQLGKVLHRQLRDSLEQDEETTQSELLTCASAGYLQGFLGGAFQQQGLSTGWLNNNFELILNGVYPKSLFAAFQVGAIEAKQAEANGNPITTSLYQGGLFFGQHDAEGLFLANV